MFKNVRKFLKFEIWGIRLETLGVPRRAGIRFLKVALFSFRKLSQDQLLLRAPALAFFSLFSVVPMAALAFGIAKGFGLQDVLKNQLQEQLALPLDAETMILEFAQTTLEKTRGGLVAGLGLIFLFLSVALLFSSMEDTFNKIWGIRKGRVLSVKIRDYFSVIFIGTILLLVSLSLTVAITNTPSVFGYLDAIISFLISLVPFLLSWFLFTFLIMFMPNRKISLKAGLTAGVVSGTLYQLFLNFYIRLQLTVSIYNAIYGSFAALPLFLIWLQISWICLLYGAEVSYSYEKVETMGFKHDDISIKTRKIILLRIIHYIVKSFRDSAASPPSADQIARDLEISAQLVNHLLEDLVDEKLIAETIDKKHDRIGYQPGVSPDELTLHRILKIMEEKGTTAIPGNEDAAIRKIIQILDKIERKSEKISSKIKIEDLA